MHLNSMRDQLSLSIKPTVNALPGLHLLTAGLVLFTWLIAFESSRKNRVVNRLSYSRGTTSTS